MTSYRQTIKILLLIGVMCTTGISCLAQDHLIFDQVVYNSASVPVYLGNHLNTEQIEVVNLFRWDCSPCRRELADWAPHYDNWRSKYNMRITLINVRPVTDDPEYTFSTLQNNGWTYQAFIANESITENLQRHIQPTTLFILNSRVLKVHKGSMTVEKMEQTLQELKSNNAPSPIIHLTAMQRFAMGFACDSPRIQASRYINRELTIGGLQYYELVETHQGNSQYKGYIRESENHKKVFYKKSIDAPEHLIIDVGLGMCDTFTISHFDNVEPFDIVVQDYYYENGLKHIVFDISTDLCLPDARTEQFEFIEEIGTNAGWVYSGMQDEINDYLLCGYLNGDEIYRNKLFNGECSPIYSSTYDDDLAQLNLDVTPNPFSHQISIAGSTKLNEPNKLELFDLNGRCLLSLPSVPPKLNLTFLLPGTYLIRIISPNGVLNKTIAKQCSD